MDLGSGAKVREQDERLCKLQEPDEEGWVTVVPKGKKRLTVGEKSVSQSVRWKKKNKELLNKRRLRKDHTAGFCSEK